MGRSGIALLDFYLAEATGERDRLGAACGCWPRIWTARSSSRAGCSSRYRRRDFPDYAVSLLRHSAGVGMVASRYLAATGEERLAATLPG